jgi:hypothetical protein
MTKKKTSPALCHHQDESQGSLIALKQNKSNPNHSSDEEDDIGKKQPSYKTNSGPNNGNGLNQTNILSLLQLGEAAGTSRFTAYSDKITSKKTLDYVSIPRQERR